MTRPSRPTGALALALGLALGLGPAVGARAQNFSDVVVFGDSLSDSGNVSRRLRLPTEASFTTNPDPVAAEIVARTFGASGAPSSAGGSNYAWGGACMRPTGPCTATRIPYEKPTIPAQIQQYLSARDGRADPAALYAVWGGGNDIDGAATANAADPRRVQADTLAAAGANAAHVRSLQDAGARTIVLYNLPDLGLAPFAAAQPAAFRAGLSALTGAYNQALEAGVSARPDGIVAVNAFALFREIAADPGAYGFTADLAATACGGPPAAQLTSLACGPRGAGPTTYAPGANRTHVFADDRHPTGAVHEIVAGATVAALAAPIQVSLAGEGGVEAAEAHLGAVAAERTWELAPDRPVGGWRSWAAAQSGRHKVDGLPRLGESRARLRLLTLGVSRRIGPDLSLGVAASFGDHDNDARRASLDGDVVIGSLYGVWRRGDVQLAGAVSAGGVSVDVARSIPLAAAVRVERGETDAGQFGADLELGWMRGEAGVFRHGPFAGLAWLDQKIDGYRERGESATAMRFDRFDRDSLVARGGYRLVSRLGGRPGGGAWRLRAHARFAFEREFENDPVRVAAGSNTLSGRFALSGFAPPRQRFATDLGVAARLDERMSASAGYAGRFGSDSRSDHRIGLGLRVSF